MIAYNFHYIYPLMSIFTEVLLTSHTETMRLYPKKFYIYLSSDNIKPFHPEDLQIIKYQM